MKRLLFAALCASFLLVTITSAIAQPSDPDANGVGIYADLTGNQICGQVPIGLLDVYLLLTNPVAGVGGWECRVDIDPGPIVLAWQPMGPHINVLTPPEFIVGLAAPHPQAPVIQLMKITLFIVDPLCHYIYLRPASFATIPGEMAFYDGINPGIAYPMYQSTGGPDIPVYGINCDCPPPVATQESSWGSVKALFD